jgi:ACS family tartrate transporter-like MFS transporter
MHSLVTYGIFLWLPKMLQDVSGTRGFALSTITAIPFGAALVAMVLVGRHSDRTGERKLHVAACASTAAVGLGLAAASQGSLWVLVLSFTLSQMAQRAMVGPFWAMPPIFLGGTAAAAGIALINAIGNLGGFAGRDMGHFRGRAGDAGGTGRALVLEALLVLSLRLPSLEASAIAKGRT